MHDDDLLLENCTAMNFLYYRLLRNAYGRQQQLGYLTKCYIYTCVITTNTLTNGVENKSVEVIEAQCDLFAPWVKCLVQAHMFFFDLITHFFFCVFILIENDNTDNLSVCLRTDNSLAVDDNWGQS